jgi:hypothetical protein
MVFWQDRGDYLPHFEAIGHPLPSADDTAAVPVLRCARRWPPARPNPGQMAESGPV